MVIVGSGQGVSLNRSWSKRQISRLRRLRCQHRTGNWSLRCRFGSSYRANSVPEPSRPGRRAEWYARIGHNEKSVILHLISTLLWLSLSLVTGSHSVGHAIIMEHGDARRQFAVIGGSCGGGFSATRRYRGTRYARDCGGELWKIPAIRPRLSSPIGRDGRQPHTGGSIAVRICGEPPGGVGDSNPPLTRQSGF
jgi:hypothetical protein